MRIDRDTFREILDSILRNRSRSLLTGFGVFWGIFMLMLLTGGGQGLKQLLQKNFDGFAQNTCIVFANQTSKPYLVSIGPCSMLTSCSTFGVAPLSCSTAV